MKQFIVENYEKPAETICLSGDAFHYLVKVRRSRVGDSVMLAFPNGEKASYMVDTIDTEKKALLLAKTESITSGRPPAGNISGRTPIILLQWVLKGAKMDTVVRQATEVGVRYILPVYGEFSVVQEVGRNKAGRYARIVKEARQQSNSPVPTEVLAPCVLENALNAAAKVTEKLKPENALYNTENHDALKLYFTEKDAPAKTLHEQIARSFDTAILAVGAEGGISPAEYALLEKNGFEACHFETNILRAETASLYALAAFQTIKTEEKRWQLKG